MMKKNVNYWIFDYKYYWWIDLYVYVINVIGVYEVFNFGLENND